MGPWTVVESFSKNRLVTVSRPDATLRDIAVPFYLPMPEKGSLVTVTDNVVVAVLSLPSLGDIGKYQWDVPQVTPGDYVTVIPDRGFLGFMKSLKSVIIGHALNSCMAEFSDNGLTLKVPALHILGTNMTISLKGEDPTDANSTTSIEVVLGQVLTFTLSTSSVYLSVMGGMLEFEMDSSKVISTVIINQATGERKTLLEEHFGAGEEKSSSALGGEKAFDFASAVKASFQKTLKATVSELIQIKSKKIQVDAAESAIIHGNISTISGDQEVTVEAPTVSITATPGAMPAGTVKISNGQLSSITMSPTGGVGIGATTFIELGGTGEFATNGVVMTRVITNLATAVQTIAAACGGFPPTAGANGANAPLGLVYSDIPQIMNKCIQMTAAACMPNHLPV